LTLLVIVALASSAWSVLAWYRVERAEEAVAELERRTPLLVQRAQELVDLRAEVGTQAGRIEKSNTADLIPFLESAAVRAGIRKEALSISADAPKPMPGRPDLVQIQTRMDIKAVDAKGLIQFLASVESNYPAIETREIVLSRFGGDRGWSANVVLSLTAEASEHR